MANLPTESATPTASPLRGKLPIARLLGAVDDSVFAVERVIVSTTLILMTIAIFLKIAFDYSEKLSVRLEGDEASSAVVQIVMILIGVVLAAKLAAERSPTLAGMSALTWGIGILAGVATWAFSLLVRDPPVLCVLLTLLGFVVLLRTEWDRPRPIHGPTWDAGTIARLVFAVGITAILLFASVRLDGYSWAPNVALTLLLWMAFLGASMATYQGRHLTIDAIRKAIPERAMPWFNAVSLLVAAAFTGLLLYLSWKYYLKRLDDPVEPGRVPDHIKVLAIPASLALVTVRFTLYAIGQMITGALKLHLSSDNEQEVSA